MSDPPNPRKAMADESRNHPAAFSRPKSSHDLFVLPRNPEFAASTWPNDVFFATGSPPHSGHAQPSVGRAPNSGHWVPIPAHGYQVVHPYMQQQAYNDPLQIGGPRFAPMQQGLEHLNRPVFMPTPNNHMATTNSKNNEIDSRKKPLAVPQQTRAAPRPRKSTKRRKMCEWGNHSPRNAVLPAGTTTEDVFTRYPNHITDDDLEELWRLGSSAKDLSNMMPQDTRFNEDGELVSQHHSWIQQKIKQFPRTSATAAPANRERQSKSPMPQTGFLRLASEESEQGVYTADPPPLHCAAPQKSGAELCKLVFRHHPFDSRDDTAFAARMSIMLAKTYKIPNPTDQGHHEWGVLHEYIMRVMDYHRELVMRKLRRTSPDAEVDECHARYYDERSRALIMRWRVGSFVRCSCGPHAAHQLYAIFRLIFEVPTEKSSPKSKPGRVIYNCTHPKVSQWKIMARVLYTLIETTDTLINGTAAYHGTTGLISAVQPYQTMLQSPPHGHSRIEALPLTHDSSYEFSPEASRSPARLLEGSEEPAQIDPQLLEAPQGSLPSDGDLQQGTVWMNEPVRDWTQKPFEDDLSKAAWTPETFQQQALEPMQCGLPETTLPVEPSAEHLRDLLDSELPEVMQIDPGLLAPRQTSSQNQSEAHRRAPWTQEPVADEDGEELLESDLRPATLAEGPFVQETPQSSGNHLSSILSTDMMTSDGGPAIRDPNFTSQGSLGIPRLQMSWNHEEENILPHIFDNDIQRDLLYSTLPANMFIDPQDTYLHRRPLTGSPTDDQSLGFDLDALIPEQNDDEWLDEWSLPNDYVLQGERPATNPNGFVHQTPTGSKELETMSSTENEESNRLEEDQGRAAGL